MRETGGVCRTQIQTWGTCSAGATQRGVCYTQVREAARCANASLGDLQLLRAKHATTGRDGDWQRRIKKKQGKEVQQQYQGPLRAFLALKFRRASAPGQTAWRACRCAVYNLGYEQAGTTSLNSAAGTQGARGKKANKFTNCMKWQCQKTSASLLLASGCCALFCGSQQADKLHILVGPHEKQLLQRARQPCRRKNHESLALSQQYMLTCLG